MKRPISSGWHRSQAQYNCTAVGSHNASLWLVVLAAQLAICTPPLRAQDRELSVGMEARRIRESANSGSMAIGPKIGFRQFFSDGLSASVAVSFTADDFERRVLTSMLGLGIGLQYRSFGNHFEHSLGAGVEAVRYSADPVDFITACRADPPLCLEAGNQYVNGWDLTPSVGASLAYRVNRRWYIGGDMVIGHALGLGTAGYDGGAHLAPQVGFHIATRW